MIIFSLGLEVTHFYRADAHCADSSLQIEGRPDVVIDLNTKNALAELKEKPFTIKEGATFRMKARFKVQHQILSGLKYVQVVKRMGVSNKMQEMIVRAVRICYIQCSNLETGFLLTQHNRQARVREKVYVFFGFHSTSIHH